MMLITSGDTGVNVAKIQQRLIELGFLKDVADGIFGVKTLDAVVRYQKQRGLVDDGRVGSKTWGELFSNESVVKVSIKPLSATDREKLFGKFAYKPTGGDNIAITGRWTADNIVSVYIPQLHGKPFYEPNGKIICNGHIRLHKLVVNQVKRFFQEVQDAGLLDRIGSFDGAFEARFVRGSKTNLSNHSWGTAFDINQYANGLGKEPAKLGKPGSVRELVPIAERNGLYWGGNFPRKDGMHFEVYKIIKEGL